MHDDLYVCFTMDCERIRRFSPPGGPQTWEISERAIEGFSEVLLSHGLVGTFFIVPETAHRHRDLFLELEERGFELGMHFHPQSFGDLRYGEYLGAYSYEEQVEILSQAADVWAEALGRRPRTFRPGNFSANDSTFRALYDLGFRQGSVSAPERVMPKYRAVWAGAYPYAHHVHPHFRLIPGDLDFFEVPVTEDRERRTWEGKSAMELRVEMAGVEDHRRTIDRCVADMVENQVPVKTIVAVTHNFIDYEDPEEPRRRVLEEMAEYVQKAALRFGLKLRPATIEQIHRAVDEGRLK